MAPALDVPKKDSRSWDALTPPLAEWILEAVAAMGFRQMTPVQAATLPQFLAHKDVVVEAVTGSGKTLAYLIPAVQRLVRLDEPTKRHHVGSVVVSPTRELAAQIHTVLLSLLRFHAPSAELLPYLAGEEKRPATTVPVVVPQLLVGGSNTPAQDLGFFLRHSPNLLIASPGRLVELLSSPHIHCTQSSFDVLILDEADRLLDLGFKNDITGIISRLPKQRRTGLFSASVSEAVAEIIRVGLRNPVKIQVRVRMSDGSILEDRKVPASLQMTYIITRASQKLPALSQLLTRLLTKPQRSIVFLSTCAAVDYFQHVLPCLLPVGYSLISLHGKHMAKVRQKNFDRFLTSVSPTILLTTDLAARGLDIPQVDLVVQVDPPSDPKVFIHRSGRAGRAGRKGLAVIMLHPGPEEDYVRFLEVRKTPITRLEKPRVQVSEDEAGRATQTIRKMVSQDRALYDKAQKAFVSWVRSYGAHQAASIFLTSGLDWADLGHAWGLLRMPRMPELKGWQGDKTLGVDMDWDGFAYRDQDRERARLEALEAETSGPALDLDKAGELGRKRRNKNEAWSGKLENEEVRAERREKRSKKREAKKLAQMTPAERAKQLELDHLVVLVREKNLHARAEAAAATASGSQHEFEGFDD